MIKFRKENNFIILNYTPQADIDWILKKFKDNDTIFISRTFTFSKNDVYENSNEDIFQSGIDFIVATLDKNYYKFDSDILSIEFNLYIEKNITIKREFFITYNNISIFHKINNILDTSQKEIFIGSHEDSNFPFASFERLVKSFPNSTELKHYANARIDLIIQEYLETEKNSEEIYQAYMNKKISFNDENILSYFSSYETDKYTKILSKLEDMLKNEDKYNEHQWQKEILQIIQLIYPKYIRAFENVKIRDTYKPTDRFLDFMLVDANGNIDIVEIKKPFGNKNIVSHSQYRDNHIPLKELSGSIMQIEKYIFYLNKWGKTGDDILTSDYKSQLPEGFNIKITNPSGLIIMGREDKLSLQQKSDFEIIKRKYKNIIDIMTYDDLIRRLKNIKRGIKK